MWKSVARNVWRFFHKKVLQHSIASSETSSHITEPFFGSRMYIKTYSERQRRGDRDENRQKINQRLHNNLLISKYIIQTSDKIPIIAVPEAPEEEIL